MWKTYLTKFKIKVLRELGIERTYLKIIKVYLSVNMLNIPMAALMLNKKKNENISSKISNATG